MQACFALRSSADSRKKARPEVHSPVRALLYLVKVRYLID